MENKYIIYSMLILLIFIMGLSAVSADDINTTDAAQIVENDNVDTIMSEATNNDVMGGEYAQKDLNKKNIDDKKSEQYMHSEVTFDTDTYKAREDNINITGSVYIFNGSVQIPYKGNMNVEIYKEYYEEQGGPMTTVTTDEKGRFSLLYPGNETGKYKFKHHIGNNIDSYETDFFIIEKNGLIPTDITIFVFNAYPFTWDIGVRLWDVYDNTLLNKTVNVTVEDKTYTINTDIKGSVYHKIKNYGKVNVSAYFAGDSKYASCNKIDPRFISNHDGKNYTNLTIDKINNINLVVDPVTGELISSEGGKVKIKSDETITITGKLTDNKGNPLKNTEIGTQYGYNYENYTFFKTNEKGVYTYTTKPKPDFGGIDVTYFGSTDYTASFAYVSYEVEDSRDRMDLSIAKPLFTKVGDYVTIKANVKGIINNIPITYTPITIKINGKEYTNKTDGKGLLTYNYKTDTVGLNNVTISYKGNSKFYPVSSNTTFKVLSVEKTATKITVNTIGNVQKDSYVTVTGKYTAVTGINLTYTPIRININGVTYTNKTDGNGVYSYTFKASTLGTNNVSVSYAGNSRFNGDSASTTFNVLESGKTATKITVNSLGTVQKDSYVTVTGRYTAVTGINLTYTPIRITINGETYTNKTNGNGIYSYTYKASKLGVNNITVSYPGNARFIGATASTTFNVANKTATKITVNTINDVQKDSYVTVTGRYTAVTGINLTYTPIKIVINGVAYTNKTNGNGIYSYTFKASTLGTNNVTAYYAGNSRFIGASASTTFNVVNKTATSITVNSLGTVGKDEYVTITGRYTASTGINLTYTPIKIVINGVTYTNKTNGNGIYSYTFKASTLGTNSVTVSYAGNSRFIGASASTTFNVVNKTSTKITVNNIGTVKANSYVTVTGKYTAATGINLTYTPIRININGMTYTNKTNAYGIYSYTFKASNVGVNNITVSYPGNARFIGATAKTTLTVKQ